MSRDALDFNVGAFFDVIVGGSKELSDAVLKGA